MYKSFLAVCLAVTLLLSGCVSTRAIETSSSASEPEYGGVYHFPLNNEPASLDPAYIIDGLESAVASNIYVGLVQFNEKMQIEPALAVNWEKSRDGLIWSFKLRRGVHFHNGKLLTSADVIYSFQRLLSPKVDSPRKNLFMFIQGAEKYSRGEALSVSGLQAPDAQTVVIKLSKPLAPFLSILAMPNAGIIPQDAAEKIKDFAHHPIGAGPFAFKEWRPGQEILLTRNDGYFAGKPYLDEISFQIILDPQELLAKFEAGELDEAVLGISKDEEKRWAASKDIKFIEQPIWGVDYIGLNMSVPPLNNRLVRQAMNYAIDWSKLLDDSTVKAKGIIPPGMPGYNKELVGYSYNLKKARQLMAEAGYPDGVKNEIELWVSNSPGDRMVGEYIVSQLAQIGINVKLGMMDWNDLTLAADRGDLPMFLMGWVADYPDPDTFLYPLFYSKNKGKNGNNTMYDNPQVDRLLDKARNMDIGQERLKTYAEIEKIIVKDAPWIFMYHYKTQVAFQPWVHGRVITGMGESSLPMNRVWVGQ